MCGPHVRRSKVERASSLDPPLDTPSSQARRRKLRPPNNSAWLSSKRPGLLRSCPERSHTSGKALGATCHHHSRDVSHLGLFATVRQSGQRVIIDGPCLSACTLVLSTIPHGPICVTARAIVGFHAARRLDWRGQLYAAPSETRLLAATYPAPVRAWIERNGGVTEKPMFLRSRQLAALYPRCQ
jgi:hypothetical protein